MFTVTRVVAKSNVAITAMGPWIRLQSEWRNDVLLLLLLLL